jgi:glycosyltransferase involved in cell wall biosynthesis
VTDTLEPEHKLNLLILASSLWIGGAETVVRHLAETIDRRRFNVTVCHLKQRGHIGDEIARAGIDIVGIAGSQGARVDYFSFTKLLKVIRDRRVDVVHTHTAHGLVDATLCKFLTPGLKVVHTFHFGNYPHTRPRILWMERICSRAADRLYAVGEVQRQQLRKVHWFRDDAIGAVWNGVTLQSSQSGPSFRERFRVGDAVLIGTIATLIEQKGLRDLMRVARRVCDAGHNAKFVIVGEGQLRAELEAIRRELGLDGTVVLTGWVTNAADLALPAFDVFFQPSLWEAMSLVILEAMAARKPIVATRVGENPHIIEHGEDGMLVNVGDLDGMAAALGELIAKPALRARLGDNARRKVERRFTVEHMTRAYEQIYLDVSSKERRMVLQRDRGARAL